MKNSARIAALAVIAAAVGTPAFAAPAGTAVGPVSPNTNAKASINIKKPLTLKSTQDMDFGDVTVLDAGTISMDKTGTITCVATALTCGATGSAATYNVTGTNNQPVTVTAPNVSLTGSNGGTLTLVLSAPTTVTLTNAGSPGTDFSIGGSIAIPASVNEGPYTGDLNITVEY